MCQSPKHTVFDLWTKYNQRMIRHVKQRCQMLVVLSLKHMFVIIYRIRNMVRDSVVRIAIRYGLDGPGIESRWRRDFPHQSRPALMPKGTPVK
jgi:hypothetical protein